MTSIHRDTLVALLRVLTLMVSSEAQYWTENRIINGCRFEPDVRHATIMECDYDGISYIRVCSMGDEMQDNFNLLFMLRCFGQEYPV